MTSTPSTASSSTSKPSVKLSSLRRKSNDVAWEYGILDNPNNVDKVKCKLCGKIFSGGAYRIKEHIGHIVGNVSACPKSSKDDQLKCRQAINDTKNKRNKKKDDNELRAGVKICAGAKDDEMEGLGSRKLPHFLSSMDKFASPSILGPSSSGEMTMRQQNTDEALFKERLHTVHQLLARYVLEAGIPLTAVTNDSFKSMVEAIGQFGPGLKPPSPYMLREPLLKEEVKRIEGLLKMQKDEWKVDGCSIITDVWINREKRSVINLCVNCKVGTTFLERKECSKEAHTAEFILEYVLKCIEQVGRENVVQVVTDNAINNMVAAKMFKEKMPGIFWSSCATQTINLMLESIGKLPRFKKIIDAAKSVTIFIYAHQKILALMRTYTKKRDVVRLGVSRFASSFLTLQSLVEKKYNLRAMFVSTIWDECKWAKKTEGKVAYTTMMNPSFWDGVTLCLKVFEPLVKVLRLVDGDKKSSMAFLYGELMQAKQEIKEGLHNLEKNYQPILQIVDEKMEGRLDTPLHVAAYFLNPFYFYKDPNIKHDEVLLNLVFSCVKTFFWHDVELQTHVINVELPKYKMREDTFGNIWAIKGCENNDDNYCPVLWWHNYGHHTPNLQKMATRILSLTSSSFECQRNWSTFDKIHTKITNRLDANQLNNLEFVQVNARLMNQHKKRNEKDKNVDVLISSDARNAQAWLVHCNDDDELESDLEDVQVRELDDDVDPSDEEEEEINLEFEWDDELVFERYGEDEDIDIGDI